MTLNSRSRFFLLFGGRIHSLFARNVQNSTVFRPWSRKGEDDEVVTRF